MDLYNKYQNAWIVRYYNVGHFHEVPGFIIEQE